MTRQQIERQLALAVVGQSTSSEAIGWAAAIAELWLAGEDTPIYWCSATPVGIHQQLYIGEPRGFVYAQTTVFSLVEKLGIQHAIRNRYAHKK